MLIIFTGNGKGKTTAALGQALRAVGGGKRVLMIQFIKGPWKSGEDHLIAKIKNLRPRLGSVEGGQISKTQIKNQKGNEIDKLFSNFEIIKSGRGFVGILGDKLPIEEHQKAAEEGLAIARSEIESGNWDILILDEINNAVSMNLIPKEEVLGLLSLAPNTLHLIFTGRDAPPEFIEAADLVTEMRDIKHHFTRGIKAKRGIEY